VRTLAGLPLVAPRQHSPAVMLNLLGDLWFDAGGGRAVTPNWAAPHVREAWRSELMVALLTKSVIGRTGWLGRAITTNEL
jgi:hypothetical protein